MVKIHYPLTQCNTLEFILLFRFLTKFKVFVVQNDVQATQNGDDAEQICDMQRS